ncbi:hypothetical protein T03_16544 [Trichinella britovi]|uniref:Uncharacterized protein n=1 Tax=Trichinella britovi TaxID=45882 RepID=A0A0V0YWT9_TRIBR|nr:hypothetical protein T03_13203 [Trichinella britovi]KRY06716.1 hypothetical protein T03_16544 [Trichinella britovi]
MISIPENNFYHCSLFYSNNSNKNSNEQPTTV